MPYINFRDSNDKVSITMQPISAQESQIDALKANIVADIKARIAAVPGVGTITATESVEVITVI